MSELLYDFKTRRALREIRANLQQREENRERALLLAVCAMGAREVIECEAKRLNAAQHVPADTWFKNIVEYDAIDEMAVRIESVLTVLDQDEQADVLAVQAMMQHYKV